MPTQELEQSARHMSMSKNGLRIGKHFSPGGKHLLAGLADALEMPASAMQIFGGNPQRYWCSHTEDRERAQWLELSEHLYKVVHTCYIINICDDPAGRGPRMSTKALVNHLEWAEKHACEAVVFHPGSPKTHPMADGLQWCTEALKEVMTLYEGPVHLLLENAASRKKVGGRTRDLTDVISRIGDERLGYCIDTTHAYCSGSSVEQIETDIRDGIETGRLRLVHFNTPDPLLTRGCEQDRHSSTFTDGKFKMEEIRKLFLASRTLPIIIEGTPDLPADMVWLLQFELAWRNGDQEPKTELPRVVLQDEHRGLEADLIP